jgi:hypothetical protein
MPAAESDIGDCPFMALRPSSTGNVSGRRLATRNRAPGRARGHLRTPLPVTNLFRSRQANEFTAFITTRAWRPREVTALLSKRRHFQRVLREQAKTQPERGSRGSHSDPIPQNFGRGCNERSQSAWSASGSPDSGSQPISRPLEEAQIFPAACNPSCKTCRSFMPKTRNVKKIHPTN